MAELRTEDQKFLQEWLEFVTQGTLTEESVLNHSVIEDPTWVLDRMITDDPERAWPIIHQLITLAPTDEVLAFIGTGHLEDLLWKHGKTFIDRVEVAARQEPKFRKCLRVVWGENSIPPEIWKRVNQACGNEPQW